jgi:hypothetical protein
LDASGQTSIFDEIRHPALPDRLTLACTRVRHELVKADEGGYGKGAWYSYLNRLDIEALLAHAESTAA